MIASILIALLAVLAISATVYLASDVLLVLFLAVVFATFLVGLTRLVQRSIRQSWGRSLAVVVSALLLIGLALGYGCYARIENQLDETSDQLSLGLKKLGGWVDKYPIARSAIQDLPVFKRTDADRSSSDAVATTLDQDRPKTETLQSKADTGRVVAGGDAQAPSGDRAPSGDDKIGESLLTALPTDIGDVMAMMGRFFESTLGVVVNVLLIFFVGVFLADSPKCYRDGTLSLLPPSRRDSWGQTMDRVGSDLIGFLIGRGLSMAVTGIGATLLLLACGVPLAFTLGVLTALLTFIPNIGAAVALALATLAALPQGGTIVTCVIVGYLVLQLIESYVITPVIQKKQVDLPPALTLAVQAIFSILFGFLGAVVATPLLVVVKRIVQDQWVANRKSESETGGHTAVAAPDAVESPESTPIEPKDQTASIEPSTWSEPPKSVRNGRPR